MAGSTLPLVTVEMLTYNRFQYIEDALNSVFMQDYPNIELIISDDGSKNFDRRYIERILTKRSNNIKEVKIIHHEQNLGTVRNLNGCIKASSGQFFIGLSSDDIFKDSKVISDVVDYFLRTGALIVTSKRALFNDDINHFEILPTDDDIRYLFNGKLYQRLVVGNFISGACTFYSKELFDKYGLFDEEYRLLEDYPQYLRLAREGIPIHFYDRITIYYRDGGISSPITINQTLRKDFALTIKKEILPYPDLISKDLYMYKHFEMERLEGKSVLNPGLFARYPAIYLRKILSKVGLRKSDFEKFIENLSDKERIE